MSSMEELSHQYGPAPEDIPLAPGVVSVRTPVTFEEARPTKEEARAALSNAEAGVGEIPDDIEDIDPRQWLQHDDSLVIDYVITRAGRLKVAALDENEVDAVRRLSEKPHNPAKPQLGKEIKLKLFRLWMIAYSLNKAYGYTGTANELNAELIARNSKLSGEITTIVTRITEISGYREDGSNATANFLSMG